MTEVFSNQVRNDNRSWGDYVYAAMFDANSLKIQASVVHITLRELSSRNEDLIRRRVFNYVWLETDKNGRVVSESCCGPFENQVELCFARSLIHEEGGQDAGKLEVDRISLDVARAYAEAVFKANNRSLDDQIPEFDQNFLLAQNKTKVGKTQRRDMPVINDTQVREFQQRLKDGHLDIEKPLAPHTNPGNPWPEGLSGEEADEFVRLGLEDKDLQDDKVKVTSVKVAAKDLKPIQKQIYFDKCMGATGKFGVAATRSFLSKSLTIMSSDNYIIDGHHRWTSALVIDPAMQMPGIKIDLPISKLLPVSLAYGDAIGNRRNA